VLIKRAVANNGIAIGNPKSMNKNIKGMLYAHTNRLLNIKSMDNMV